MKSQWWWVDQLTMAFNEHLRNADMYQQVCLCILEYFRLWKYRVGKEEDHVKGDIILAHI